MVGKRVRCRSHTHSLMGVSASMVEWRLDSTSVVLVHMVLLEVGGSSSTAAAGMAPRLGLWDTVD